MQTFVYKSKKVAKPKDLFKAIFGLSRDKVRQLVHDAPHKHDSLHKEVSVSSKKVLEGLETYLQVSPGEATELVGWTASRKSRNSTLDRDALDRAYTTLEIYERVANYLGENGATWLREANPHLAGRKPVELLETRAGYRELSDLLDAIESGNYL